MEVVVDWGLDAVADGSGVYEDESVALDGFGD